MTTCTCPNCSATLNFTMKEVLLPYTMQLIIRPEEGRCISAETVSRMLFSLSRALKAAGNTVDHDTEVFFTDAGVGQDGSLTLVVAATPIVREAKP